MHILCCGSSGKFIISDLIINVIVFLFFYLTCRARLFIMLNDASMSENGVICSCVILCYITQRRVKYRFTFVSLDINNSAGSATQRGTLLIWPERIQYICCRKKSSLI